MAVVISTRPLEDALVDAEVLARSGITCLAAPMMTIIPFETNIDVIFDKINVDAVALTSRHAVGFISETRWTEKPVLCVGESTARLARAVGIKNVITGPGDGQGLAEMIAETTSYKAIFWPSAIDVGFDLAKPLAEHQITLHRHPVYKAYTTDHLPDDVLKVFSKGDVATIMVHSGRAGTHLVKLLDHNNLLHVMKDITIVAVSARVAGHCGDGWRKLVIAQKPRRMAMFDAIIKIMNNDQSIYLQ